MNRYVNPDVSLLILRIFLAGVIAPHGAQKLLGWFDGFGYSNSIKFFTETVGIPYVFGFLIILAESIGMVVLAAGLMSRILSASLIVIFCGAIATVQIQNGFFMNWFGNQPGEGIEFSLLVIGMSATILLHGPGKYSLDNFLFKKSLRMPVREQI